MSEVRTRFSTVPPALSTWAAPTRRCSTGSLPGIIRGLSSSGSRSTDQERSQEKFVTEILAAMTWLGLDWDEGPYRQIRTPAHLSRLIDWLLTRGAVYYCNCPPQELERPRQARPGPG